jgi:transcriptional regulator with XRE-family HTH domain
MMAKEKSRAELLAEEVRSGKAKRNVNRRPTRWFPMTNVMQRRKKLGLKQAMVAEECGLEGGSLSAIERGHDPRLSDALRLAAFYGEPVEKLFGASQPKLNESKDSGRDLSQNETLATTSMGSNEMFVDPEGEIHQTNEGQKL